MTTSELGKGVICFTNPQQLPFIREHGVYGNVSVGDSPSSSTPQAKSAARQNRFGKLKDLFTVSPGDTLFLFERDNSCLYGAWTVQGDPVYSTSPKFDPSDTYPYRLRLQRHVEFSHPVPVMELRRLLDRGLLWSIRSFERDTQGSFASVNPISREETQVLMDLLYRYNHSSSLVPRIPAYQHAVPGIQQNFCELVDRGMLESSEDRLLTAATLAGSSGNFLEAALHCFLAYNLTRRSTVLTRVFGDYDQVLREVPVSTTGQHRVDFVLMYDNPQTNRPTVFSLLEVKRDRVTLNMLRQLLEYLKLFADRLGLDSSCVEGIYIGSQFEQAAIKYAQDRAQIETERPLRLIRYERTGDTIAIEDVS